MANVSKASGFQPTAQVPGFHFKAPVSAVSPQVAQAPSASLQVGPDSIAAPQKLSNGGFAPNMHYGQQAHATGFGAEILPVRNLGLA